MITGSLRASSLGSVTRLSRRNVYIACQRTPLISYEILCFPLFYIPTLRIYHVGAKPCRPYSCHVSLSKYIRIYSYLDFLPACLPLQYRRNAIVEVMAEQGQGRAKRTTSVTHFPRTRHSENAQREKGSQHRLPKLLLLGIWTKKRSGGGSCKRIGQKTRQGNYGPI